MGSQSRIGQKRLNLAQITESAQKGSRRRHPTLGLFFSSNEWKQLTGTVIKAFFLFLIIKK